MIDIDPHSSAEGSLGDAESTSAAVRSAIIDAVAIDGRVR